MQLGDVGLVLGSLPPVLLVCSLQLSQALIHRQVLSGEGVVLRLGPLRLGLLLPVQAHEACEGCCLLAAWLSVYTDEFISMRRTEVSLWLLAVGTGRLAPPHSAPQRHLAIFSVTAGRALCGTGLPSLAPLPDQCCITGARQPASNRERGQGSRVRLSAGGWLQRLIDLLVGARLVQGLARSRELPLGCFIGAGIGLVVQQEHGILRTPAGFGRVV